MSKKEGGQHNVATIADKVELIIHVFDIGVSLYSIGWDRKSALWWYWAYSPDVGLKHMSGVRVTGSEPVSYS